jgi:hypothetical protein
MSSFRTAVRCSIAAALVAACADGTPPTDPSLRVGARSAAKAEDPSAANRALAAARSATARFHDAGAAVAAGYAPLGGCVAVDGVGGMGIHYVNRAALLDPALDPANPEILVYEPQKNGRMRLVAVEYMVLRAASPSGAPSLFGHTFENGPMLPAGPNGALVPTYALHAWAWQHNPSGTFAAFNPTVSCQYAPAAAEAADAAAHAHH